MNNQAGKGDSYRKVNKKIYDENYNRIFGTHVIVDNYYSDGYLKHEQEVVFYGSKSECIDWLEKNQVRISSMCGQYVMRDKETHSRLTSKSCSNSNKNDE